MKKWLSLLLAALMLFSLTACTQEEVDTTLEILDAVVSALPEEEKSPAPQPEETLPDSQAPPAVEDAPTVCPVSLPEDGEYDDKIMLDHSADEITTAEADELIKALEAHFGTEYRHFYTGVSYRHCILWKDGNDTYDFSRPHDIIGRCIRDYLPSEENGGGEFYRLMKESYEVLNHHPVNEARRARGLKPANSAWLWSPGKKPQLPNFREKWGLNAAVISAVDLIKGIGLCAKMKSIDVDGATGNVHTNYTGKAEAAISALSKPSRLAAAAASAVL